MKNRNKILTIIIIVLILFILLFVIRYIEIQNEPNHSPELYLERSSVEGNNSSIQKIEYDVMLMNHMESWDDAELDLREYIISIYVIDGGEVTINNYSYNPNNASQVTTDHFAILQSDNSIEQEPYIYTNNIEMTIVIDLHEMNQRFNDDSNIRVCYMNINDGKKRITDEFTFGEVKSND